MSKVSWYKQRLKALLFKARFADKVDEIKPVRTESFIETCVAVQFLGIDWILLTFGYLTRANGSLAFRHLYVFFFFSIHIDRNEKQKQSKKQHQKRKNRQTFCMKPHKFQQLSHPQIVFCIDGLS